MKRTLILSVCLCALSAVFAQRHDTVVIITKAEAPVEKVAKTEAPAAATVINNCCTTDFNQHTYANDPEEGYYFTRFELAVKGGVNYLNEGLTYPQVSRADVVSWNVGLDFVYNFNDLWGLRVGAGVYDKGVAGFQNYTADIDVAGRLNITNLLAPHRSELSRRFNVYGNIGLGFSPTFARDENPDFSTFYRGYGLASLEVEARINKLVGIFADGDFRAYFTSPSQMDNASEKSRQYTPRLAANVGVRFHF